MAFCAIIGLWLANDAWRKWTFQFRRCVSVCVFWPFSCELIRNLLNIAVLLQRQWYGLELWGILMGTDSFWSSFVYECKQFQFNLRQISSLTLFIWWYYQDHIRCTDIQMFPVHIQHTGNVWSSFSLNVSYRRNSNKKRRCNYEKWRQYEGDGFLMLVDVMIRAPVLRICEALMLNGSIFIGVAALWKMMAKALVCESTYMPCNLCVCVWYSIQEPSFPFVRMAFAVSKSSIASAIWMLQHHHMAYLKPGDLKIIVEYLAASFNNINFLVL